LGNRFLGLHLFASPGESYGEQYLMGGQRANILTYLSNGDGGDQMSAFEIRPRMSLILAAWTPT
jgi:hypothetical protein